MVRIGPVGGRKFASHADGIFPTGRLLADFNVDADTAPEMSIVLIGDATVTGGDFIL